MRCSPSTRARMPPERRTPAGQEGRSGSHTGGPSLDPQRSASKQPSCELVACVTTAVEQRAGRRHGREWRFRCLQADRHRNGDAHASARWHEGKAVWHCDVCGVGGGALDLARRLGVLEPHDRRPNVLETVYAIRNAAGELVAEHVRRDRADGSKTFAWRRAGRWGLGGLNPADLPLYGTEAIAGTPAGSLVVVVEGEKVRDALTERGILVAGTVTGASGTPSPAALEVLVGKDVVLWPDADGPGRAHMQRIAERLVALGIRPRWLEWGGERGSAGRRRLHRDD